MKSITTVLITGRKLLNAGNVRGALATYTEVAPNARNATIFHDVGLCYEALEDSARACAAFREAVLMLGGGHSVKTVELYQSSLMRVQIHWRAAAEIGVATIFDVPSYGPPVEDGFRTDSFEFLEVHSDGLAGVEYRSFHDSMGLAQDAYSAGDVVRALRICEAAVNHNVGSLNKAMALSCAAHILAGGGSLERARRYLTWAVAVLECQPADGSAALLAQIRAQAQRL